MTQERIRELLNDVAGDVPAPDIADRAWQRSRRIRRRRRVAGSSALAVGVVVAALAVAGVVDDTQPGSVQPDRNNVAERLPVPEAAKPRPFDARVDGAPAWIGPTVQEEERLPQMASGLPESIDLTEDVETTDTPGRSVAAFAASDSDLLEEVLLVDKDGDVSRLELDEPLERPSNPLSGDSFLPLNISSLSPSGRYLVFAQQDDVVLYDLINGDGEPDVWPNDGSASWNVGWAKRDGRWWIQLPVDLMDPATGDIEKTGESGSGGGSQFPVEQKIWPEHYNDAGELAAGGRPSPEAPRFVKKLDEPLFVTVDGPDPRLLVLPGHDDILPPRSRVAGWLDRATVAFQSQDYGVFHLLSWNTRNGAVRMVSEIELPDDWDDGVIASWAKVSR